MNDYMSVKFPKSFHIAKAVCGQVAKNMNVKHKNEEVLKC